MVVRGDEVEFRERPLPAHRERRREDARIRTAPAEVARQSVGGLLEGERRFGPRESLSS